MDRQSGSMQFSVVGVSHHSAPLEVRERVAVGKGDISSVLPGLAGLPGLDEAVLVSTCNRTELIGAGPTAQAAEAAAVGFFCSRAPAGLVAGKHLYRLQGQDAVLHLFRVASSLDSLVIGEPQILGQVKQAFHLAREAGLVGPRLRRLFDKTFSMAKRVRSQTRIGYASLSVAGLAVEALQAAFGTLSGRALLIVGAGKMGEQALHKLRKLGAPTLFLANRTLEHACDEARKHGAEAVAMSRIDSLLETVDAVICSTSAPHTILSAGQIARAMERRGGRELHLVDLAVPRDVDPLAAAIPGCVLWDVDGLSSAATESQRQRREEAQAAERLVEAEAAAWSRSQCSPQYLAACFN